MSNYYERVKKYYKEGKWSKKKVRDAVGRWITEGEYELITGEKFE